MYDLYVEEYTHARENLEGALKDMHAMIVLTPGHAQVAVEAWSGAREYFLIETTLLPFEGATESELNQLITYYDQTQWQEKLGTAAAFGTAYVVDCDLIQLLDYWGITQNGGSVVGWDNNTGTFSSNPAVAFLESPALSLDLPSYAVAGTGAAYMV